MNLEGKYIKINRKDIKRVITFLHNNGYRWGNVMNDNNRINSIEHSIKSSHSWLNYNEELHIRFNEKYYYYNDLDLSKYGLEHINIDIYFYLIREEKLKRILK